MNKKLITVISAVTGFTVFYLYKHEKIILDAHPDIDRKIARKAYRKIMLDAYRGKIDDETFDDEEKMERLFLKKVKKLS